MGTPGPTAYNMMGDLIVPYNPMTSKSPRIMESDEIAKNAKRNKSPDQGSYTPLFKLKEGRTLGCFNFKSDRNGYIEEASLIGKESPKYHDKNYSRVEPSLIGVKIHKPPADKKIKDSIKASPVSYENNKSFMET